MTINCYTTSSFSCNYRAYHGIYQTPQSLFILITLPLKMYLKDKVSLLERSPMCPVTWFYWMASRGPSNLNLARRCSAVTNFLQHCISSSIYNSKNFHQQHSCNQPPYLFTNTETDCWVFRKLWNRNKRRGGKTFLHYDSFYFLKKMTCTVQNP